MAASDQPVRAVDLDDLDVGGSQRPSQPDALGAGALDADPGDGAEGLQPPQELEVSGGVVENLSTPSRPPMLLSAAATFTSRWVVRAG